MKKAIMIALAALSFSFNVQANEIAADSVATLRGGVPINTEIEAKTNEALITGKADHPDVFNQQAVEPPMIPHSIEGYKITTDTNMCLMCHEAGMNGATALPESHFLDDRSGETTDKVGGRRYFCTQCHTSQVDNPPLVTNNRD